MTLPFPIGALRSHIAVLGKTGSGKSSTSRLIVEHVVGDGDRVCILDPAKSDWWGITSSADGKSAGLPFHILGGPHGHVSLRPEAGGAVGDLVGNGALKHTIVDMADFPAGGLQTFFNEFAPALMKEMRGVLYLVIEEAHEFAPKERAGFGNENMMVHWAKKLATAGRSKGIRLIVASQRTQALHNAVLGSCETMIAHRLTLPADQKPVIDWLKGNSDKATVETVAGSLSSLATGTAWVCSGEERFFEKVKFPKFSTFDNTATPSRDSTKRSVTMAPVDVEHLRKIFAVEEAAAAPSEGAAKRDKGSATNETAKLIEAAEKRSYLAGIDEGIKRAVHGFKLRLEGLLLDYQETKSGQQSVPNADPSPERVRPSTPARKPAAVAGAAGTSPLLAMAVRHHPARLTWGQLAALAGRKARGGHFNTERKRMLDRGLIREEGDAALPTDAGFDAAGGKPVQSAHLASAFVDALPGPANIMLAALLLTPRISIEELGRKLELKPSGGHWNTGLATLQRCGLITKSGNVIQLRTESLT